MCVLPGVGLVLALYRPHNVSGCPVNLYISPFCLITHLSCLLMFVTIMRRRNKVKVES